MSEDFYKVLGVSTNATADEIKTRFRFLSHAYHPDKFGTDAHRATAEEEFKRINEAYRVLSNGEKRENYDASRLKSERADSSKPQPEYSTPVSTSESDFRTGRYIERDAIRMAAEANWAQLLQVAQSGGDTNQIVLLQHAELNRAISDLTDEQATTFWVAYNEESQTCIQRTKQETARVESENQANQVGGCAFFLLLFLFILWGAGACR